MAIETPLGSLGNACPGKASREPTTHSKKITGYFSWSPALNGAVILQAFAQVITWSTTDLSGNGT